MRIVLSSKKSTEIPVKALRFQEVEANEDGEVISPRHWPPLPPRDTHGTHFC